jgi:ATP-dependent DNA helicase RecG
VTTPEQIDLLLHSRSETQQLEFKEAKTQFDNIKLYEYCVALANEGGGLLILGITDKRPRRVVGSAAFNNLIEMAEKLFKALGFRVDIEEVQHPDGRVVVFHIPSRPKGIAYHYGGKYLMRIGEALESMTEDRLRAIFREGAPSWINEVSKRNVSAQDIVEYLDTQAFFELIRLPYPANREGVIDRLMAERLIERDTAGFAIQRLGALLLAKRFSDFDDIARKAPRVIVYDGKTKGKTKLDQEGTMGYAVGFQRLVQFVMNQLPQNEEIENALRKETKLVPEDAIRELVANALIHQDFEMSGASVMVEIFDNRIEVTNPGEPIVDIDRFIDGYQSRNEDLAKAMRRFGICEEKSSGVDNVVAAAEAFQLPAPVFRVGLRRTEVIVKGPQSFDSMTRDDRIRACYQHCALRFVNREWMTNQSLRARFKLPEDKSAVVSQVIALAVEEGKVRPDATVGSSRKLARYVPFWGSFI